MDSPRRAGRPRAASREILEEAACELFLERGYDATSVADITSRAGVSRSTFFNYVESKSDLLWARFDDAVEQLRATLARRRETGPGGDHAEEEVRGALAALAADLPAENVALAYTQAGAMGLGRSCGSPRPGGSSRSGTCSLGTCAVVGPVRWRPRCGRRRSRGRCWQQCASGRWQGWDGHPCRACSRLRSRPGVWGAIWAPGRMRIRDWGSPRSVWGYVVPGSSRFLGLG